MTTYAIMDSQNCFVDSRSIYFDKTDKHYIYLALYEHYGVDLFPSEDTATQHLHILENLLHTHLEELSKYKQIPKDGIYFRVVRIK